MKPALFAELMAAALEVLRHAQGRAIARRAHRAKRRHRLRAEAAPIAHKLDRLDAMCDRRKAVRQAQAR